MHDTEKKEKKPVPPDKMIHFSWGGNTREWQEEAEQIADIFKNQQDSQEKKDQLYKKTEFNNKNKP